MIKYDYVLRRKKNDQEIEEFKPKKIPKELPNLVMIEGPNSSGKSTLLNIIALSLYGHKSTRLNDELLSKINFLRESDHQKIKFELEIRDQDNQIILKSEKKDFDDEDILLMGNTNGKLMPISYESFISKYNLIYDIPSNPTKRLYDLLHEIREEQLRYGDRIKNFSDYLDSIIEELEDYRDPNKIEQLKQKISECQNEINKINDKLPHTKIFKQNLEKYAYLRQLLFYTSEILRLDVRLNKIKDERQEITKKKQRVGRKSRAIKTKITFNMDKISNRKNILSPILKKILPEIEKNNYDLWNKINVYNIKDCELDKRLELLTLKFKKIINKHIDDIEKDDKYKNANIYNNMITFLKQYQDINLKIPKFEITIKELIDALTEEKRNSEEILSRHENLISIVEDLDEMLENINILENNLIAMKEIEGESGDVFEEEFEYGEVIEADEEKLSQEINELLKKKKFFYNLCIENKIDPNIENSDLKLLLKKFEENKELEPYFTFKENQLLDTINRLNREVNEMESNIKSQESLIGIYQSDLESLLKMEPHPYEKYKDEINVLYNKSAVLSARLLGNYNQKINDLIKKKIKKIIKTDYNYYDAVFTYLGKRIGKFRHIDEEYNAKYINLVEGFIVTEQNQIIHLSDMGTGQSQSAYLLGLLNIPNDDRKLIAMFDEVAMMDDFSLQPVYDRLISLYKDNKLLLGIVVQKANEIRIQKLGE